MSCYTSWAASDVGRGSEGFGFVLLRLGGSPSECVCLLFRAMQLATNTCWAAQHGGSCNNLSIRCFDNSWYESEQDCFSRVDHGNSMLYSRLEDVFCSYSRYCLMMASSFLLHYKSYHSLHFINSFFEPELQKNFASQITNDQQHTKSQQQQ
jgi:hypothetical protein